MPDGGARAMRPPPPPKLRWPNVWHHQAATEASLDLSHHELRTDRLRLVPLDADGMRLFVKDWPALLVQSSCFHRA